MATDEVLPAGDVTLGGWNPVGASTASAALADGSDTTRVDSPGLNGNGQQSQRLVMDLDAASIPTGNRVAGVRLRWRVRGRRVSGPIGGSVTIRAIARLIGGPGHSQGHTAPRTRDVRLRPAEGTSPTPWVSYTEAWQAPPLTDGVRFEPDQMTVSLEARKIGAPNDLVRSEVAEVAVDLEHYAPPKATYGGPTSDVTDTTRPTITWTYNGGRQQTGARVRIWRYKSGDNWVSPPPADLAPVVDSGVLSGQVTSWTPDFDLEPTGHLGDYYLVYVQVRQQWDGYGGEWWSPLGEVGSWSAFSIGPTTAPAMPSIDPQGVPDGGRVDVHLLPPGGAFTSDLIAVEYRDLGQDRWYPVRQLPGQGSPHEVVLPYPVWLCEGGTTVPDFEAADGREYRARVVTVVGAHTIVSEWATSGPTPLPLKDRWLTCPEDPTYLHVRLTGGADGSPTIVGREVAMLPAGMDTYTVESDVSGWEHPLTLWSQDASDRELVAEVMRSRRTLLMRGRQDHLYFRWVGDRQALRAGEQTSWQGTAVKVGRPALRRI